MDDIIPSPCIGVCQLDTESGLCLGCFRTRDEIKVWCDAGSERRQEILIVLKQRRIAAGRISVRDRKPRRRAVSRSIADARHDA